MNLVHLVLHYDRGFDVPGLVAVRVQERRDRRIAVAIAHAVTGLETERIGRPRIRAEFVDHLLQHIADGMDRRTGNHTGKRGVLHGDDCVSGLQQSGRGFLEHADPQHLREITVEADGSPDLKPEIAAERSRDLEQLEVSLVGTWAKSQPAGGRIRAQPAAEELDLRHNVHAGYALHGGDAHRVCHHLVGDPGSLPVLIGLK
ncbi:hypothetical protein D3C71_1112570 [compost metagenome]